MGPTNDDPGRLAAPGELGVLGEEAVPGMDRLGAGPVRGLKDAIGVEVALGRGGPTDGNRFVAGPGVHRARVRLRIDRHRPDPHAPQRAHDADRDHPAVGDQDLLEHRGSSPRP